MIESLPVYKGDRVHYLAPSVKLSTLDVCFWNVFLVSSSESSCVSHFTVLTLLHTHAETQNTFDMFYQSDFASTLFFSHAVLGSSDTTKLNKAHNENEQCGANKIGEFGGGGEVEKNRRELWALCQQEAHAAWR